MEEQRTEGQWKTREERGTVEDQRKEGQWKTREDRGVVEDEGQKGSGRPQRCSLVPDTLGSPAAQWYHHMCLANHEIPK